MAEEITYFYMADFLFRLSVLKYWIRTMKQEAAELEITTVFVDQVRKFVETENGTILKNLNYSEN